MALRVRALLVLSLLSLSFAAGCGGGGSVFGKQYEYEEDLYLALDGSATLIVNTSIPALVALRGADLSVDPAKRVDREKVRQLYSSPVAEVTRVSREWRRGGRRFVQVRLDIPDVRKLSEAAPFAWSRYRLEQRDGLHVFRQHVGASAFRPGTLQNVGWTGKELVAFRLHLPSRIEWHNARDIETNQPRDHERGNILRWEQVLADRLDGVPVDVEVRMQSQSILYRTLWLFAGAFLAAVALLAFLIWLMVRKGARQETSPTP
jgi:hypothetical protein